MQLAVLVVVRAITVVAAAFAFHAQPSAGMSDEEFFERWRTFQPPPIISSAPPPTPFEACVHSASRARTEAAAKALVEACREKFSVDDAYCKEDAEALSRVEGLTNQATRTTQEQSELLALMRSLNADRADRERKRIACKRYYKHH